MLFYQIYAELNALNAKYNNLETAVMDNYKVCDENTKGEESLNQRIYVLEEQNIELRQHHNQLVKEFDRVVVELTNTKQEVQDLKSKNGELTQHNTMVTKINSVIMELNDVITVLNNKHVENYYFLRVLCKKEFNQGVLKKRGVLKK